MRPSRKAVIVLTAQQVLETIAHIAYSTVHRHYRIEPHRVYAYTKEQAIDRYRLRKTLHYLKTRGYVHDIVVGKKRYLEVTIQGREKIRAGAYPNILSKPKHWDKRWRIVIFDIPAQWNKARKYFRVQLRAWGFLPMQRSVYVYPFECHKELQGLIAELKLHGTVQYMIAEIIEGEEEIINKFIDQGVLIKQHVVR